MFVFNSTVRTGTRLQRSAHSISLDQALGELLRLYQENGGEREGVEKLIAARIEGDLGRPPQAQGRIAQLLRARDLHEFVQREPDLAALKLQILELLHLRRGARERWLATRDLLTEHLPLICRAPPREPRDNLELYKEEVSARGSRLGQLLVLLALFNFDSDAELPPDNLVLRFRRGHFPDHAWEAVPGAAPARGAEGAWYPENPLCRWEYLAADLTHELVRSSAAKPAAMQQGLFRRETGTLEGRKDAEAFTLYCRLEPQAGGDAGPHQMSLFPVDPATLVREVQRQVHRHLGAEGVRQLALLLGRMDSTGPGRPVSLPLEEAAAAGAVLPARVRRERARKLQQVVEQLCGIELQRVSVRGDVTAVQTSRLLTPLGRDTIGPSVPGASPAAEDPSLLLRLAVDPVFYRADGGSLGDAYRRVPEGLLTGAAKEHPYALALQVFLAWAWNGSGESDCRELVQLTAARLFHDAGLWVRDSERYRALEQLKRDLTHLRDLGLLGRWRVVRASDRNAWEHQYRLEPPRHGAAGAEQVRTRGWA
jgi:hypothetical protein